MLRKPVLIASSCYFYKLILVHYVLGKDRKQMKRNKIKIKIQILNELTFSLSRTCCHIPSLTFRVLLLPPALKVLHSTFQQGGVRLFRDLFGGALLRGVRVLIRLNGKLCHCLQHNVLVSTVNNLGILQELVILPTTKYDINCKYNFLYMN